LEYKPRFVRHNIKLSKITQCLELPIGAIAKSFFDKTPFAQTLSKHKPLNTTLSIFPFKSPVIQKTAKGVFYF
jgi:hypothetical protein